LRTLVYKKSISNQSAKRLRGEISSLDWFLIPLRFGADAPEASFHSHCKIEIMSRQHVIEDRKMPFDMNVFGKIPFPPERQGIKPAIPVKGGRNQQGLTSAGFYLDVLRLQEIGEFLPSWCSELEINCAFVQETEASVPDDWL